MITELGIDIHGNFWFTVRGCGNSVGVANIIGYVDNTNTAILKNYEFYVRDVKFWM